jgi:hypothetical protein
MASENLAVQLSLSDIHRAAELKWRVPRRACRLRWLMSFLARLKAGSTVRKLMAIRGRADTGGASDCGAGVRRVKRQVQPRRD